MQGIDLVPPTQRAHQIGLVKLVVVKVGRGDVELRELYLANVGYGVLTDALVLTELAYRMLF